MPVASGLTASSGRFKSNLVQYNVEKSNKYIVFAVFSLHVAPESHLSHHAASMHGIALARRARPWILYGPSEQSRWAPQLGQRSWQACMSIIWHPHMRHSFFLPAAIHHAQDPLHITHTGRHGTRGNGHPPTRAPAPGSPPACLDRRRTLPPRLRGAAELKFAPSANPLRLHILMKMTQD